MQAVVGPRRRRLLPPDRDQTRQKDLHERTLKPFLQGCPCVHSQNPSPPYDYCKRTLPAEKKKELRRAFAR
ncbi:hypothetical protein OIU78_022873, partial [Salix suchowensis]